MTWTLDEKLVCSGTIIAVAGGTVVLGSPLAGAILMLAGIIAVTIGLIIIFD